MLWRARREWGAPWVVPWLSGADAHFESADFHDSAEAREKQRDPPGEPIAGRHHTITAWKPSRRAPWS